MPPTVTRAARLTPGLIVVATATAVAFAVTTLVPAVGTLTVAVVVGVLTGGLLPERTREGTRWATRVLLRLGVVLLGLQLGLGQVFGLGLGTVLAVVVTVLVGFSGTLLLGRLLGVTPGLRLMVATGFSICGASAIAAMETVSDADEEEVVTAVTLVTLYGSLAIAAVPAIGSAAAMSAPHLGAWAGLSVHEVAQVVAAASSSGAPAVAIAVVVKLARVVMLAPMVAAVSVRQRRRPAARGARPPIVPMFVLGFLAMVAVRSSGLLPAAALTIAQSLTTLLFTAALFGLGAGVRLTTLVRTGRRGLALGALSTLLVALTGLAALALTG